MTETQTVEQIFTEMEGKFKAEKAVGINATFQFNITGDGGGVWHAKIADGAASFGHGEVEGANCVITSAGDDWLKIVSGSMNPQMAFMTGKLKVQGDLGLATKLGSRLSIEDIPAITQRGDLSGADIEGMVGRAWRTSLLAGADHVTREALAEVVSQFMPSTQGLERELQETAAILECTDRQFLPAAILEKTAAEGGRAKLQARLTALKQIVKES